MNQCLVFHRLFEIIDNRKRLVLHFDQICRFACGLFSLSGNRCDRLALVADFIQCDNRLICNELTVGLRIILACDHDPHTGNRFGFFSVNSQNTRMRIRTSGAGSVELPREIHVRAILCSADHFADTVFADLGMSNHLLIAIGILSPYHQAVPVISLSMILLIRG